MKRRSFVLFLSALTMSAALIGTSPVLAETKETTEAADSKEADAKDADTKDSDDKDTADSAALEDGVYTAEFDTDSSMFHVNEACEGKGTLTVKDGIMTIHVSMPSKNIVNLYPGLAEDAQKEGAELLQPTTDTVTYSDGMTEEVNGFDVPVPALDEEFDLALIGTKGTWYDHKVSVSNPEKIEEQQQKNCDTDGPGLARVVVLWRKKV